jgi:hypothetical protein
MRSKPIPSLVLALGLLALPVGGAARAAGDAAAAPQQQLAYEDRIADLERTVQVLAEELERTREGLMVPDELPELEGRHGYGPAASKVYGLSRGLSIGGYGEAFYRNYVSDKGSQSDTADMLRAVLYFGYKFSDRVVFNSEIEFEHATTDAEGSVSVEFATLDFLFADWANARAGLLLLPMGWLNELHEPPFFYGVNRPDVERFLIPSTWRENGGGVFGRLGEQVEYQLYAVNGMDATGFRSSGLRDGRQKGSKALAESLAVTGRIDWTPTQGLLLGASFYAGDSGQNQRLGGVAVPDSLTTLFDVHAQYRWRGLHLRGLYSMAFVDDAGSLTQVLQDAGELFDAGDLVVAQHEGPALDALGARERQLESFGAAVDRSRDVQVHTVGIQLRPIPNVVLKADYRNRSADKGSLADEFNLGVGYVF